MAARGEAGAEAAAFRGVEPHTADRAEGGVGGLPPQRLVEEAQHVPRVLVAQRDRAQRMAGEPGQHGRRRALAGHVPDQHQPAVGPDVEAVVEVAADGAAVGDRVVADRDLEAGDVGQPLRQQPFLERARDVGALLVEPRALERLRGLVGELGQERPVGGHEAPRLPVAQHERGEHAAGERDRDHDHRLEGAGDHAAQLRIALPVVERLEVHRLAGAQRVADGRVDVQREAPPGRHHGLLEAAVVAHLDLVADPEGERSGGRVEVVDGLADDHLADLVGRAGRRQGGGDPLEAGAAVGGQLGLAARLALARQQQLALAVVQRAAPTGRSPRRPPAAGRGRA